MTKCEGGKKSSIGNVKSDRNHSSYIPVNEAEMNESSASIAALWAEDQIFPGAVSHMIPAADTAAFIRAHFLLFQLEERCLLSSRSYFRPPRLVWEHSRFCQQLRSSSSEKKWSEKKKKWEDGSISRLGMFLRPLNPQRIRTFTDIDTLNENTLARWFWWSWAECPEL